jgi:hypothetical protein
MHMLTGLVLGELLMGAGLFRGKPKRPSFELASALPGRVRVRISSLRGDALGCERVRKQLEGFEHVSEVRCDQRTGSVLVHFQDSPETRQALIDGFTQLAEAASPRSRESQPASMPQLNQQLIELGRGLNARVLQASGGKADLEGLLAAGLLGFGIKTLLFPGTAISRWQGMTLCYWAYNIMRRAAAKRDVSHDQAGDA